MVRAQPKPAAAKPAGFPTKKIVVAIVAAALVSSLATVAMISLVSKNNPKFMHAEQFSLDSFVGDTSDLSFVGQNATAKGTATSPVELTDPVAVANTALTKNDWTYTLTLKEKTPAGIAAGTFKAELFVSGETLNNQPAGAVYLTQADSNATAIEGAAVTWDIGSSMPDTPLFVVKVSTYTPTGNTITYTLESANVGGNYVWVGVGGTIDGKTNPTLNVTFGDTVHFVSRHGSGSADTAPHRLDVDDSSDTQVAGGSDVVKGGPDSVFDWTPGAVGAYTYDCYYHSGTQHGNITVQTKTAPPPVTYNLKTGDDPINNDHWVGVGGSIDGLNNPTLTAKVGQKVTFVITQADNTPMQPETHNIAVNDSAGAYVAGPSSDIHAVGSTASLDWTPTAAGTYTYSCTYHAGMKGTVTVT